MNTAYFVDTSFCGFFVVAIFHGPWKWPPTERWHLLAAKALLKNWINSPIFHQSSPLQTQAITACFVKCRWPEGRAISVWMLPRGKLENFWKSMIKSMPLASFIYFLQLPIDTFTQIWKCSTCQFSSFIWILRMHLRNRFYKIISSLSCSMTLAW